MRRTAALTAILFTTAMLPCRLAVLAEAEPRGIRVAIDGDDRNPGTEAGPFRTLDRAPIVIRAPEGVKSRRIVLQWLWLDCDQPLALLPDAAPYP